MENYAVQKDVYSAKPNEDEVTKTIEKYTASMPSSAYLGDAVAAMGVAFLFQVVGRGKWETLLRSGSRPG